MYSFSIGFTVGGAKGAKTVFSVSSHKFGKLFRGVAKIFRAENIFQQVFRVFQRKHPRETIALMHVYGPKIKCPRHWAQIQFLDQKSANFHEMGTFGVKVRLFGGFHPLSAPGAKTLSAYRFLASFGAPFSEKGHFLRIFPFLEQNFGFCATFTFFPQEITFGAQSRPKGQNGTPKWLRNHWFHCCFRRGGGGRCKFQHFTIKCIIPVIFNKLLQNSVKW